MGYMKRIVLVLIVFFVLAITANWFSQRRSLSIEKARLRENDKIYAELGSAVFAIQEIKKGDLISSASLEERKIRLNMIPDHVVMTISALAGCRARFGITKGDMVSQYDLDPYPPELPVQAVLAIKDIGKGNAIMDDAVELITRSDEDLPKRRFERMNLVIGRRATRNIAKMQILRIEDVYP